MSSADVLAAYAAPAGLSAAIDPSPVGAWLGGMRAAQAPRAPLLAPMAGVSDAAYRLMARSGGASLAYSEMVSVNGLHYGSDKTWDLVLPDEAEPDLAVQLFGSEPARFAEAARGVAARLGSRLALIDVNMACPVRKVVRGGAGSALMDDPSAAAAIIDACVRGVAGRVPITAKIRSGRRDGQSNAVSFAQALASAGAAAVAVHGRSAAQLYTGAANWDLVHQVAKGLQVPVIGSGDVRDAAAAARMRLECACSAVMVARGSYGNPWVFANACRMASGKDAIVPTVAQRIAALECHVRLLVATGAHLARGRSLCGWYLRGLPHAAQWRNVAMSCVTPDDYLRLVDSLRARLASSDGSA